MNYSGKTLEELERIVQVTLSDVAILVAIQQELVLRKQRREQKNQLEKSNARELRARCNELIQSMLTRSQEPLNHIFAGDDRVEVELTFSINERKMVTASREQLIKILRESWLIRVKQRGVWIPLQRCLQDSAVIPKQLPSRSIQSSGNFSKSEELRAAQSVKTHANRTIRMAVELTSEQEEAVRLFNTGDNLKINAFAGTGKTTTLMALAQSTGRTGLYLAFNRAIVAESKEKFSSNVECRTTHSIAFKSMRGCFSSDRKLTEKANAKMITSMLDIPPIESVVHLDPYLVACVSLATIRSFAYSRAKNIRDVAVPLWGVLSSIKYGSAVYTDLANQIYTQSERIWNEMTSPRGKLPLGHDGYVKLWALSRPRLQFDFLLIDEAQDTNDVVLAVLEDQQCQVVYVGDKYQQIYEWRGAVNALEKIMTPRSCHLQRSFRFGPRIAMVANQLLDKLKSSKRIVGSSGKGSILNKIDLPDVLIGRTNAGILTTVADFRERGVKVFVEGGIDELKRLVRAVFELEEHGSCNAPEFFGFHSWDEVVRYSETDAGKDLVSFVSLVNSLGKKRLWRIICSCEQSADSAQVTVSTAHRSKGREWDRVRLLNDFVTPEIDESGNIKPLSDEDHRVLYVAVTRAKRELDLGENVAAYLGRTSRQANG